MEVPRRIAPDGRSFTEEDFAQLYRSQHRHWWERLYEDRAGATEHAQSGDDQAGATEHAQSGEDQAGATEHAQSGENQAGTVPLDQAGGVVHVRVHPCRQKE